MQTVKKYLEIGLFSVAALLNVPFFIAGFIGWWIGCAIANRFPPLVGRFRDPYLQTPMVLYRHPKTGARVLLIGTIHIADPEYFSQIYKQIEAYEKSEQGATVLYEAVKQAGWDASKISKEERENIERLRGILEEMKRIAVASGLQHQFDGMPIKEDWINTDIGLDEIVKGLGKKKLRLLTEPVSSGSEIDRQMFLFVFDILARSIALGARFSKQLTRWRKDQRVFHDLIVEHRNDVGFRGIVEYADPKKLTISIWGGGHVPGLDKRLRKAGYRQIGVRWMSAYRLRNPPLHRTIYQEVKEGRILFKRRKRA